MQLTTFQILNLFACKIDDSSTTPHFVFSGLTFGSYIYEKKCHVMHFHFQKAIEYNYYFNNHVLTVDTTHKDIEIVFQRMSCGIPTSS